MMFRPVIVEGFRMRHSFRRRMKDSKNRNSLLNKETRLRKGFAKGDTADGGHALNFEFRINPASKSHVKGKTGDAVDRHL